MSSTPHVAFVGLGYIGLPTAVVMANSGLQVTGVDVNAINVDKINRGEVTIVEPGLEDELKKAVESGRFTASTEQTKADAYIIAVPTPFTEGHDVDMKFIYSAAEAIAPQLEGNELIVLESTSPPLTTQKMAKRILELRPDLKVDSDDAPADDKTIYFAHCPERILPGNAMTELRTNDRIIGGQTSEATRRATEIYASFCEGELLPTNDVTAEMAKLTENSFRDVNIAFANELSLIADRLGIDVWELIELANHHPRVNILQPGPGVGGHCIAVDPWFIVSTDPENSKLIKTARHINDDKPNWVINKVVEALGEPEGKKLAVLGLAFKPDIDDLRESPALNIACELANRFKDIQISVVEPNITQLPDRLSGFQNVELKELDKAVDSADVVLMLVDHIQFKEFETEKLKAKKVIDTKGIW
ncbi:UDP-N-acetyl-D-mannosamine dehydrogenase [Corynebacterium sp. HMSC036D02]|uniref:UDP-N-acetyl-D-mannosamine dehydrogenase n=1 Tax=Corynebacterium sp. HMSC036D02 TaxID=1715013 RepID=UPI0008AA0172|nr:UDP-N-acetyl-D-mannosamine dehydrogenase [Corynebacterium sp. HMSC036D02]OHO63839.1 UDP-N-acetyl-D-mannosaminuronic acid dehydrogenase [Corynebacterium sp. HMSC036D02]